MSSPLLLLSLLALASPVFIVFDTTIANLALTLWTAVMLGVSSLTLRPAEAAHVWRTIRVVLPLALVAALWMIVQTLPTPFLAHPIWQSAAAFDAPPSGKISADPGLTLQALLYYVTVVGVALAALCVAIDRRRAHQVLRVLVAVTGIVTIAFVVFAAGGRWPNPANASGPDAAFAAICNLGMLLAASLIISAVDQYQLRRPGAGVGGAVMAEFCAGGAVFAICLLAAGFASPRFALVAGLCGLVPVFLVAFLRHVPSHGWEKSIVVGVVVIVATVVVVSRFEKNADDLALRATAATPAQSAVASRMMADAGPLGMGAGTYEVLLPIYRGIENPQSAAAPSAAVTISVELGRVALAIIVAIGAVSAILLFRRARARGRDSLYAAAGAGCMILLTLEMFGDASLVAGSVAVLAAVTIGLALGQSVSVPRG